MENDKVIQAMRLFVGNDPTRDIFHKPYEQKGFYYATDAHSLIRVNGSLKLELASQERPETEKAIKQNNHEPIEINLPELESYLDTITPDVADAYECSYCSGNGYEECDLGHEHECDHCDGEGEIAYSPVKFVKDKMAKYQMYNGFVYRKQLQKMFDACKILGIEKVNKISGEGNQQYKFETPEILFLIMPCMCDDEDYIKTTY